METVTVHKAGHIGKSEVPGVSIQIGPEPFLSQLAPGQSFETEAKAIAEALYKNLPGGTLDHLVVELLRMCASHLTVPYSHLFPNKEAQS